MSDFEPGSLPSGRPAETLAEVEDALLSRWPESRLEPSLDRIADFVDLLGQPQRNYDVVQLTGTNGKTSTARMIESLLRGLGLRTGRFTSPHQETKRERIVLDGEPLSEEAFVSAFNDVAPYTHLVDARNEHPLSFFETVVGMSYAAFSDAPVDVAVVEVGMGGQWDATNVADARVAVLTPIALDHTQYLGSTVEAVAREKAGIIKHNAIVVSAPQTQGVLDIIQERVDHVGATLLLAGRDFSLQSRVPAVGGQQVSLHGLRAAYDELFLPLYGAHQAENAVLALAAVEALIGGDEPLSADVVQEAFEQVTSPGRLEIIRRSPTIVLDAAHNPHGAQALVDALEDSFTFSPLIGVVGVMGDKDYEEMLSILEPHLAHIVCTQNSTGRALPTRELAEVARGIFGVDRVSEATRLIDAIDEAAALAEAGGVFGESLGSGGVLVTGSVVTVGEARAMLRSRREDSV
ncbi:MAG: bifunctional folylpolyglutamate synthase/dihydrofolate synthase [Marmoricola sp.]